MGEVTSKTWNIKFQAKRRDKPKPKYGKHRLLESKYLHVLQLWTPVMICSQFAIVLQQFIVPRVTTKLKSPFLTQDRCWQTSGETASWNCQKFININLKSAEFNFKAPLMNLKGQGPWIDEVTTSSTENSTNQLTSILREDQRAKGRYQSCSRISATEFRQREFTTPRSMQYHVESSWLNTCSSNNV